MNQNNQSNTEHTKTSPDIMPTESGAGQPDDDAGSITSGSPRHLVLVSAVVVPLFFASVVFSRTTVALPK